VGRREEGRNMRTFH